MFELSIACKYLIPRWRQLSVSIISMISILVISLVVWLILVFFSVTNGLESNWIEKLVALTAPVRIFPTQEYYQSYYYQIDSISELSDYTYKTLREKAESHNADPYQMDFDEEVPIYWAAPDKSAGGELKDLVKLAIGSAKGLDENGVSVSCFETSYSNLQLQMIRGGVMTKNNYSACLCSYDPNNQDLKNTLITDGFEGPIPNIEGIEGILLPKNYHEAGTKIGDRGMISYYTPTTSSMQEQRIPVYVAGFYDQGVIPIGGRFVWANPEVISMAGSAFEPGSEAKQTGINVRFDDYDRAEHIKQALEKKFADEGVASYWKVETFREYPFTKDLLQQLRSQRNLFSIISVVIIVVACSNIISMLIILVNDKKIEIGILRSMGASSRSIAFIFGFCGVIMGLLGSLIGIVLAFITLHNIHLLIDFISYMQGHELLNVRFFGDVIPSQINSEALVFVLAATVLISLISGIIPAIKASLMKPSDILRSE